MCVDQDRLLYHFLVEGTVMKDGSKVQCDVCFVTSSHKTSFFENITSFYAQVNVKAEGEGQGTP